MNLQEITAELKGARILGALTAQISAICYDSRFVKPGSLFVAIPGFKADGHDYLRDALAAGAAALVVQANRHQRWEPLVREANVPAIVVDDTRRALAKLAAKFYGHPARKLGVIGVTGTDGKTSVVHLIAHVLAEAGEKTGLISTVGCEIGGQLLPEEFHRTTPESVEVQAMLARMLDASCRYTVIESTSHGLALHRLDSCEFDLAVMTNLGLDHMDFHGSQEGYLAAKARLFTMLDESVAKSIKKTAIFNADDPSWQQVRQLTRAQAFTYGINGRADVQGGRIEGDGWGCRFRLIANKGEASVRLRVPGSFNVYNALAATAVGLALGLDFKTLVPALESWPGVPGRMELIEAGQPFAVVVDYAHAPQALSRVLEFLRTLGRGRIIAVFGCIGERDKERRYPMGQIAAALADYTIVCDDNPYSEDRYAIIEDIARGLREAGKREGHDFALLPDRRQAIAHALAMAVDEDIVLLAGKGHESRVYLGDGWYDCDDREIARQVLQEMLSKG